MGAGVCLIDLWLSVPVNSYGRVGMVPQLYGTFTHYKNVMAITMRFKLERHEYTTDAYMNMYRWIGLNHFSWTCSDSGWFTRNQNMVSQFSSLSMNLRGPIFPPEILVCPYVTALLNIVHCFLNVFCFCW